MGMKILLADDDALRKIIQFKLKQRGYEVPVVADGEEALSALRENRFELLLSDMKMPKLNGLELLKEAKKVQPEQDQSRRVPEHSAPHSYLSNEEIWDIS